MRTHSDDSSAAGSHSEDNWSQDSNASSTRTSIPEDPSSSASEYATQSSCASSLHEAAQPASRDNSARLPPLNSRGSAFSLIVEEAVDAHNAAVDKVNESDHGPVAATDVNVVDGPRSSGISRQQASHHSGRAAAAAVTVVDGAKASAASADSGAREPNSPVPTFADPSFSVALPSPTHMPPAWMGHARDPSGGTPFHLEVRAHVSACVYVRMCYCVARGA